MTRRFVGPVHGVKDFDALSAAAARGRCGPITVRFVPADDPGRGARLSFAIGRRTGNAVVRNRIRRRLRAAAELGESTIPAGNYLVGAGPAVAGRPFSELRMDMEEALRRAVNAGVEHRRNDGR